MTSNNTDGTPCREDLRADYAQTNQQINVLADIRFKLLAFVPALTAAAVTLLTSNKVGQGAVFAVGLLGFVVVFGIAMYDQRNSQIYDACQHRAKYLESEKQLGLPKSTKVKEGGLYNERPDRTRSLFGITVWHDRSLAYIYSAALGGWSYIILYSLLSVVLSLFGWQKVPLLNQPVDVAYIGSIILAVAITCLFVRQFHEMELKPQYLTPGRERNEKGSGRAEGDRLLPEGEEPMRPSFPSAAKDDGPERKVD